ncbi:very long chain fatty acid elongase AAEL008004-like [Ornithodoros turicata]|uniref:very long chain fatty acid elongase AAEL008004-like n=1 Tax=Ornithodoros turicata TaxID=34597 RepID=UPI00313A2D45
MEVMINVSRRFAAMSDPRVQHWPFMDSPLPCITLIVAYVYFARVTGPQFMRDRKPYKLRTLIFFYNLANVFFSAFFAVQFFSKTYIGGGYNWLCQPVDYSDTEGNNSLLRLSWWYLMLKMFDLVDTVFFVLTKKQSHVTPLHVAHHAMVVTTVWLVVKFACGGQNILTACLNSCIHVLMYSYYCLSLMGPAVQKHLWWKRYLTQLQMAQFGFLTVHATLPLFFPCGFPTFFSWLCIGECVFFLVMFAKFYTRSYKAKPE